MKIFCAILCDDDDVKREWSISFYDSISTTINLDTEKPKECHGFEKYFAKNLKFNFQKFELKIIWKIFHY